MEDVNSRQRNSFSFPELQIPENIANIWRIERNEIIPVRFEVTWLHFLSDDFAAVVVDAA